MPRKTDIERLARRDGNMMDLRIELHRAQAAGAEHVMVKRATLVSMLDRIRTLEAKESIEELRIFGWLIPEHAKLYLKGDYNYVRVRRGPSKEYNFPVLFEKSKVPTVEKDDSAPVNFDLDRMKEALKGPFHELPQGLDTAGIREFLLSLKPEGSGQ